MATVLILDDDLGFVFWLGHLLDARGYSALPAKSVPDAALLVMQLDLRVDVLVIDLELAGALEFIATLHRSHREIKVVGVLNGPVEGCGFPGVNAVLSRPEVPNETAKFEWLQRIQRVLADCEAKVR